MAEREKILGPRPRRALLAEARMRFLMPTLFLGGAACFLILSIFLPYWRITLLAPQYPGGLQAQVYVNRVTGDVREIDGLNHYIGMRPLEEAAQLERSLSIFMIGVLVLLIVGAIYIHNQLAAILALPALIYPIVFLGDMYYWLRTFSQNLDPKAPLSGAIKPFVPPILGEGRVGQFRTIAQFGSGFYLAMLASVLILVGLYFHRRAYKPLVDQMRQASES